MQATTKTSDMLVVYKIRTVGMVVSEQGISRAISILNDF